MRIVPIELDDENLGVFAISIVDVPAIQENFVSLSGKQNKFTLAEVDKEKNLLIGPALIPNKQILRTDDKGEDYYIYFPPNVIEKAAFKFMKNSMHHNHTIMHDKKLEGLAVVETWLIEDTERDKSAAYGFKLPKGTWMVSIHVDNPDVWEKQVKSGKVKGFSIEAYFSEKQQMKSNETVEIQSVLNSLCDSLSE